jgi:hypothetical protein
VDRVEILYEYGRYGVTFKKLITPLGPEKVRSVFAKIGVSVFPDDPELTKIYYARNPLKLSDISFRASAVVNDESLRLGWRAVKQHSSCIEIDISLEDEARDKSCAVSSDGIAYGGVFHRCFTRILGQLSGAPCDALTDLRCV